MTTSDTFDPIIDEAPSRYVVGIDLGTTNSAVAYIDTTQTPWTMQGLSIPQLVAAGEIESLDTLPSFYFQPVTRSEQLRMPWDSKSPGICVGSYARDETARTSGRGIASAKSWLCHAGVDRTAALLPWHGAEDVKRLSPVEVSSQYLRHVRKAWDQQFPDDPLAEQDIVLTLPASFDEIGRELTVQAAALAGLRRVVLIEEPQAAFYAWMVKQHAENAGWESLVEVGQKILVCDIGGGTTDFSLIRVRQSQTPDEGSASRRVQFHRVAVGNHLILGGDNLDLAIARYLERKLTGADAESGESPNSLPPHQWDVLVGSSRSIKEQMLSRSAPEQMTVVLPGRSSQLIGGSLQTEVTREEIRKLIVEGFLPHVPLDARPERRASGFQEFGLPYASDPAISRHLSDFLTTHATAGFAMDTSDSVGEQTVDEALLARPDVVLFNGGFFASPLLRDTVVAQLSAWFATREDPDWTPRVLANDRLDLAVARGAAYYGIVRRDKGVRIAASLARSYYIGIGEERVICVMPGNAEPGQLYTLADQPFQLTISQPVEFAIYVSSIRLADQPGSILDYDPEQMKALPPIRTVLRARSRNERRDISVQLHAQLTEIGTMNLACHELHSDRSWKLQFDVRSATQTDWSEQDTAGEFQGFIDESVWQECEQVIHSVFSPNTSQEKSANPDELTRRLDEVMGMGQSDWPMSFLRRVWDCLIGFETLEVSAAKASAPQGRRKSRHHEARWLNLLGYSLRPGYGVALDDWRVTETWRHLVQSKLAFASSRNEWLILWRRLSGGLSRGQQASLANPLMASLRALVKQMAGKPVKGGAVPMRPEESAEAWRLLGSLELLPVQTKTELGEWIITFAHKPRLNSARSSMLWALGRLGQRTPVYGPLNTVLPPALVARWIDTLLRQTSSTSIERLAVVQMARRTDDRYRDIDPATRENVLRWLGEQGAAEHLSELVREGGKFDTEEQGQVFGEALPPGLKIG